jgi:hypothetical protein
LHRSAKQVSLDNSEETRHAHRQSVAGHNIHLMVYGREGIRPADEICHDEIHDGGVPE